MWWITTVLSTFIVLCAGQTDPNDPCRDCRMYNGLGFKPHESRCDLFYRCRWTDAAHKTLHAQVMSCPCGLYWRQDVLTCVASDNANCTHDPCRAGVITSPFTGNCRAYWGCNELKSTEVICCTENEVYSQNADGCVSDPTDTCKDSCPCRPSTTKGAGECKFEKIDASPDKYKWNLPKGKFKIMDCSPGTNFNPDTCSCDIRVEVVRRCLDMSILYTETLLIDHGMRAWIDNRGVRIDPAAKTGTFANKAYLSVPRFSNIKWPQVFGLDIEFNGQLNRNDDGPLFVNSDCNEPPSIDLRLRLASGVPPKPVVVLKLATMTQIYTLQVDYSTNAWNRVQMTYDGKNILLSLSSGGIVLDTDTTAVTGDVKTCQCGTKIGYAWKNSYFNGLMRKTDVYMGCLPNNFVG